MRRFQYLFFTAMICFSIPVSSRIMFIGSNPFMSNFTFPQDVLQLPSNFVFYMPSYQLLPWWGYIDDVFRRPNDFYAATMEKSRNQWMSDTYFQHDAKIHVVDNHMGYISQFAGVSCLTTFDYKVYQKTSTAKGILNYKDIDSLGTSLLPFNYKVKGRDNAGYLETAFGFAKNNTPMGLRVGFGYNTVANPSQSFTFIHRGTALETNRIVWGWSSTVECDNVFGEMRGKKRDGDAWRLSNYFIGPLYRGDVQYGITLPKAKLGTRIRLLYGKQSQYAWTYDAELAKPFTGTKLANTLAGRYLENGLHKRTYEGILRLYGNYTHIEQEHFKLNNLLFLGYDYQQGRGAVSSLINLSEKPRTNVNSFVIELIPNVNIYPGRTKMHFFDAGLLLEYAYNRYSNTFKATNTQKWNYWPIDVFLDMERPDDEYSYAREHFADVGIDLNTQIPLYGSPGSQLAFGMVFFANTKYTWTNKYYGFYPEPGSFSTRHKRLNYKQEVWFNTVTSLYYHFGNTHLRLDVAEPLLYLLAPSTRIYNEKTGENIYEFSKTATWASQDGVKVGFFVGYELRSLFIR